MADFDFYRTIFVIGGIVVILFIVGLYLVFRGGAPQSVPVAQPPNPMSALARNAFLFLILVGLLAWTLNYLFGNHTVTYIVNGNVQWVNASYRDPDDVFQTGRAKLPFEISFSVPVNKVMQVSAENLFIGNGVNVSCEILVNGVSQIKRTDPYNVACMVQVGP